MDAHWTEQDITVNGAQLHYYRTGKGDKPPIVLVHGFSDNGLCWTPVARALESEYDIIMPDMRGHGKSARARMEDEIDMSADLSALIRGLGLGKAIVMGHSMGANASYHLCYRFPELVRVLILEDPPWWISNPFEIEPSDSPSESPVIKWARGLKEQSLDELIEQYTKDNPKWTQEFIRIMCESKKQLDQGLLDVMSDWLAFRKWDWKTTLQDISCPMLVIAGDPEKGGIVTPEVQAKAKEINSRIKTVTAPEVGHLIRFNNLPFFLDTVKSFLSSADGSLL